MIAVAYEAIQLYMQLAESTDNELAKDVLKDIADEERVHAGEFFRLLKHLAPDEEKMYQEGAEEVEELIEKLKKIEGPELILGLNLAQQEKNDLAEFMRAF